MILSIPIYEDWGHALPKLEKPKLAKALEQTQEKLKPSEPKAEVVIIETAEDLI